MLLKEIHVAQFEPTDGKRRGKANKRNKLEFCTTATDK